MYLFFAEKELVLHFAAFFRCAVHVKFCILQPIATLIKDFLAIFYSTLLCSLFTDILKINKKKNAFPFAYGFCECMQALVLCVIMHDGRTRNITYSLDGRFMICSSQVCVVCGNRFSTTKKRTKFNLIKEFYFFL